MKINESWKLCGIFTKVNNEDSDISNNIPELNGRTFDIKSEPDPHNKDNELLTLSFKLDNDDQFNISFNKIRFLDALKQFQSSSTDQ